MPHSLFNKLPSESWTSDKLIRFCPWGKEKSLGSPIIWRTGQNPGTLEPFSTTAWSIHTGLPRNAPCRSIHYFSDGYTIFYERDETLHELHLTAIHPRAVVIICTEEIHPELISLSGELEEGENQSSLQLEGETITLHTRQTPTGCQIILTSEREGLAYNLNPDLALLDQDITSQIHLRYDKRDSYWSMIDQANPDKLAIHQSSEALLYALRDTQGLFSNLWIEDGHSNRVTLNYLLAQSAALRWLDPKLSVGIIRTAAELQTSDGRLAAFSGSEPATLARTAAWPQICRAAASLTDNLQEVSLLKRLVPKLHSILLNTLRSCHDEESKLYLWPNENESYLPELYDDTLATVDCSSFLLAEIEAYIKILNLTRMETEMDLTELQKHRSDLEKSIHSYFAHPASDTYRDRIIDGDSINRLTLSSATPVLTSLPDAETRTAVKESLTASDKLNAGSGLRDYEQWEDDEEKAPVDLSRQFQFLPLSVSSLFMPEEILKIWKEVSQTAIGNSTSAVDHHNALAAMHLHTTNLILKPGIEKEPPGWLSWLERHRKWVIPVPIVTLLMIIFGITAAYQGKKTPPRNTIQALIGLAQHHYQMDEQTEAIELLEDLYESGVGTPAVINLLAKSYFRSGDYEHAQEFFERMNRQQPNPGTELNIALSVYQQGRLDDAEVLYKEIADKYRDIQPQISERANLCIELMNYGTPPAPQMLEENQRYGT